MWSLVVFTLTGGAGAFAPTDLINCVASFHEALFAPVIEAYCQQEGTMQVYILKPRDDSPEQKRIWSEQPPVIK